VVQNRRLFVVVVERFFSVKICFYFFFLKITFIITFSRVFSTDVGGKSLFMCDRNLDSGIDLREPIDSVSKTCLRRRCSHGKRSHYASTVHFSKADEQHIVNLPNPCRIKG
jgi:hypothetical protein